VKPDPITELLYQALETEKGGVKIYAGSVRAVAALGAMIVGEEDAHARRCRVVCARLDRGRCHLLHLMVKEAK